MESCEGVDLGKGRHVLKEDLQFGEWTILTEITLFKGGKLPSLRHEVAHEWSKKQPVKYFMKKGLDMSSLREAIHDSSSKFSPCCISPLLSIKQLL